MGNFDRAAHLMPSGKLRAFTFVGSYPLFYLTSKDSIRCASCANDEEDIASCHVNYESRITCDECNEEIESAYGAVKADDAERYHADADDDADDDAA